MKFCVVTFCDCQKMVLDMTVSDLGWTLCVLSNLYIFCVWVSACVQGLLQIKILLFMVEITLYVNRLRICNDPMANNVKFRVFTKKCRNSGFSQYLMDIYLSVYACFHEFRFSTNLQQC